MSDLTRLNVSAIVWAVVFAFLLGLVIGAAVGAVGFGLAVAGVLTDDVIEHSTVFYAFVFSLGLIPNVVCGYLAAKSAGRRELIHGVVAGALLLAINGLFYLLPDDDPFTYVDGIGLFLVVPLAASGAILGKRTL